MATEESSWVEVRVTKHPRTHEWFVSIEPPHSSDHHGNFASVTTYLTVSQARVLAKQLNKLTRGK